MARGGVEIISNISALAAAHVTLVEREVLEVFLANLPV